MPWTSIQCEFKTSQSAVRPVNYRSIGQTGTGTGRQKSRPVPSMAQAIKGKRGGNQWQPEYPYIIIFLLRTSGATLYG
jgi:hypothetical protein